MKEQTLAGYTANLTVTCKGEIECIRNSYLLLGVHDVISGKKVFPRKYVLHLRTIIWKTDHKKIWFVNNELIDWKVTDENGNPFPGGDHPEGETLKCCPLWMQIDLDLVINKFEDHVFPLECKDFWLNAMRRHIVEWFGSAMREAHKEDEDHEDNLQVWGYFMSEEHYLQRERGCQIASTPAPTQENLKELKRKCAGKSIEFFDAMEDDQEATKLCDLPINPELNPPVPPPVHPSRS